MILLSDNMFDYIVRLLGWAVEGGTKVSKHPVQNKIYPNMVYNFEIVALV